MANDNNQDGSAGVGSKTGTDAGDGDSRSTGQSKSDLAANSAPGDRVEGEDLEERQDQLLDEAVEETFPASDPISPKRITK